jgi:hypothetical protein
VDSPAFVNNQTLLKKLSFLFFEKFKYPKLAINAMIGLFGHSFSDSNTYYFTTEYKYAMIALAQNPALLGAL